MTPDTQTMLDDIERTHPLYFVEGLLNKVLARPFEKYISDLTLAMLKGEIPPPDDGLRMPPVMPRAPPGGGRDRNIFSALPSEPVQIYARPEYPPLSDLEMDSRETAQEFVVPEYGWSYESLVEAMRIMGERSGYRVDGPVADTGFHEIKIGDAVYRVLVTSDPSIEMKRGKREGEVCGRVDGMGDICDGVIMVPPDEDCLCHLSAPCWRCVEALCCPVCLITTDDPDW